MLRKERSQPGDKVFLKKVGFVWEESCRRERILTEGDSRDCAGGWGSISSKLLRSGWPPAVSITVLSLAAIRITWKLWKAPRPGTLLRTTASKCLGGGSRGLMCFDSSPQGILRGKEGAQQVKLEKRQGPVVEGYGWRAGRLACGAGPPSFAAALEHDVTQQWEWQACRKLTAIIRLNLFLLIVCAYHTSDENGVLRSMI